jgi:hypothetical protein
MVWRYARWFLLALVLGLLILAAFRIPVVEQRQQSEQLVDKIHSTHLSMADVDGTRLPPPPDASQKDATVAGVDANQNGIRDDVELAIFAKYPNDAKLRAAELQYALSQQLYITYVIDTETWKAAATQLDRAYQCIGSVYDGSSIEQSLALVQHRTKEIEDLMFNNQQRRVRRDNSASFTSSYGDSSDYYCDVVLQ